MRSESTETGRYLKLNFISPIALRRATATEVPNYTEKNASKTDPDLSDLIPPPPFSEPTQPRSNLQPGEKL
jgi:hypothetical protein